VRVTCDYYAEQAAAFLADQLRRPTPPRSYNTIRSHGPVLAIMPWNFPCGRSSVSLRRLWMAGNAAILKHASNVPRCALQY